MATNTTFTTLMQDVQTYLERGGSAVTDPTVYAQIPRLINSAERKLAQALKLQGQIEVLANPTGIQVGNPVITKPNRWRETIAMSFGGGSSKASYTPIFPRSLEYCRAYYPDNTNPGPPEFYADYDYNHWRLTPYPDQTYPLEVICYMQPQLLDNVNQSNFWSDYTPNLLLYGTLIEGSVFLKQDPRVATWKQLWADEVAMLTTQDLQKILDRAAQRDRP